MKRKVLAVAGSGLMMAGLMIGGAAPATASSEPTMTTASESTLIPTRHRRDWDRDWRWRDHDCDDWRWGWDRWDRRWDRDWRGDWSDWRWCRDWRNRWWDH